VATKGDTLSVQQPNIPVSDAAYDEEINRIKELENVRIFLSQ
jgi:hypothetical protein